MKTTVSEQGIRIQGKGWQVRLLLAEWSRGASSSTTLKQWLNPVHKQSAIQQY